MSNFHPLKVVDRGSETQRQAGDFFYFFKGKQFLAVEHYNARSLEESHCAVHDGSSSFRRIQ